GTMQIFKHPNFNFVKYRWHALVLSWIVIAAGIITIATAGLPRGVEFSGGTIVIVKFDTAPSVQQVRDALSRHQGITAGENIVVQRYGDESARETLIRLPDVGQEQGAALTKTADAVVNGLTAANLGKFQVVGTQVVGPVVGQELTRKGILATVLSLGGLLLYIGFRFRLSFAVGAVVATVHDLLVTLAFLAFFRYDMTLNVIAAILTVTGYSTNDTIVIFDRVRENLKGMRKDTLLDVVNTAINQTLNRTILTAGTTLLSAVALFLFGGEVLKGFAFTMIVGVITGTYSSVFIAAAIVTFWRTKSAPRVPAAAAATGNGAARKKNNRNNRAS
ncbi:MAG: protein translocase subunit SecF, partial [Acidobacteria bacterium]|nr:protein translocase subunit SecF [Acidobacteriota bacterium]